MLYRDRGYETEDYKNELKIVKSKINFNDFIGQNAKNPLKTYIAAMEQQQLIPIVFNAREPDGGGYYVYRDGIKIYLPLEEIPKNVRLDDHLSAWKKQVMVIDVNREKSEVTVSIKKAYEEPKNKLIEELDARLEAGECVVVPAELISFSSRDYGINGYEVYRVALVNVGGIGILGAVRLKEWSTAFTYGYYPSMAQSGDVFNVVITGKMRWRNDMIYDCSRRLALEGDPWENIEKKFPSRTKVCVTCLSSKVMKGTFLASVDGLPEIVAVCDLPENGHIKIMTGASYFGFVRRVSEKKKFIRIRIVGTVDKDE